MKKLLICLAIVFSCTLTACASTQSLASSGIASEGISQSSLPSVSAADVHIEPSVKKKLSDSEQYRLEVNIIDHDSAVIRLTDTQLKDKYEVNRVGSPEMQDEYGWYLQIGIYRIVLHHFKDMLGGETAKLGVDDMQLELYKCDYNQKGELYQMVDLPPECIAMETIDRELIFTMEISSEVVGSYYIDLGSQLDIIELQTMDCTRATAYQEFEVSSKDVVIKSN